MVQPVTLLWAEMYGIDSGVGAGILFRTFTDVPSLLSGSDRRVCSPKHQLLFQVEDRLCTFLASSWITKKFIISCIFILCLLLLLV